MANEGKVLLGIAGAGLLGYIGLKVLSGGAGLQAGAPKLLVAHRGGELRSPPVANALSGGGARPILLSFSPEGPNVGVDLEIALEWNLRGGAKPVGPGPAKTEFRSLALDFALTGTDVFGHQVVRGRGGDNPFATQFTVAQGQAVPIRVAYDMADLNYGDYQLSATLTNEMHQIVASYAANFALRPPA